MHKVIFDEGSKFASTFQTLSRQKAKGLRVASASRTAYVRAEQARSTKSLAMLRRFALSVTTVTMPPIITTTMTGPAFKGAGIDS